MQAKVSWRGRRRFEAVADSGHVVTMDAKREAGGEDGGTRPMEMLLMGLGGCTGIDIIMILEKMRISFDRVDVLMEADRAPEPPQRFTDISMTYEVDAPGASLDQVKRAVILSQEKYCSAAHSLNAKLHATLVLNGMRHTVET